MVDENTQFSAFEVREVAGDGVPGFAGQRVQRRVHELPDGDVLVRVAWSSLNYKDALSSHGNRGVTRLYPHVPGIDAAGHVVFSRSPAAQVGDEVIVTGHDLGMNTSGGFAEYIRVPAQWLVPLPPALSLKESMIYGTAGLTAALCLEKLLGNGLTPEQGEVLVTGATGGVGSIAVALLSKLGFEVVACTGKPEMSDFLHRLGARTIISRSQLHDAGTRPLLKERWSGAVDVAGGAMLWSILRSLRYGGSVASCGLADAPSFEASVFPFILRNVNLLGVDSANVTFETRCRMWNRLANEWRIPQLQEISKIITFNELNDELKVFLEGGARGRCVLDLQA